VLAHDRILEPLEAAVDLTQSTGDPERLYADHGNQQASQRADRGPDHAVSSPSAST
jgi:hypothetical protein